MQDRQHGVVLFIQDPGEKSETATKALKMECVGICIKPMLSGKKWYSGYAKNAGVKMVVNK